MSRAFVTRCPRCGSNSFEVLATHSHCIDCLFSAEVYARSQQRDFMSLHEAQRFLRRSRKKTVAHQNIQTDEINQGEECLPPKSA